MKKKLFISYLLTMFSFTYSHAYSGYGSDGKQFERQMNSLNESGLTGQSQQTTIHYSNGSKSLIKTNSCGGTIYNSDGSKIVYSNR